jgi:xylulokinase
MKKSYLIGVDLGTSATKAALYRADGALVAEASASVPLYYPQPGVVEQENDDFYTSAAQTVRACLATSGVAPSEVAALAFDSQMAGVGSINEAFQPATRFDSWLDVRCQPYIKQLDHLAGDKITRITGCPPTVDHGPKMVWWKEEATESYRRVAKFLMPAGYVAGRLTGLSADQAFIDHTFIHFSSLADAQAVAWSPELVSLLGIDPGKLPRIVSPWELIGEVSGRAAADFGLATGTPVAAGAGDTAAGALGAGIVRPGMLLDTAGTAAVLAGCTDRFTADVENRALLTMHSVLPELWLPLAYTAGGGLVQRWFRDTFFNTLRGQPQSLEDNLYDAMAAIAAPVPPGADGLFFSPHLGGRICPADPAMRGSWMGFTWGHTQAHFLRAAIESVAFEYAYYLKILRQLIPDLELIEARVIGGGANNALWNQIKANVLGVPYQRLARSEFATWGCALIAGRAVGLFDDLAAAAAAGVERRGERVPLDPGLFATYQPLVEHYIAWQRTQSEAYRILSKF